AKQSRSYVKYWNCFVKCIIPLNFKTMRIFYLSLTIFCFNFYILNNYAFAGTLRNIKKYNPCQTIDIKAAFNPLKHKITGTETIRYILPSIKTDRRTPRIGRIKNFKGLKNFRGLYVKLCGKLYLMLYPDSFYKKPSTLKDYNFHQLYPYNFNKGFIALDGLSEKILPHKTYALYIIKVRFETKIPEAFGNFGHFKKETVLNAPFYPYIAADRHSNPPVNISFRINLTIKKGFEAFFDGKIYRKKLIAKKNSNFISVVLSKKFKKEKINFNGGKLFFFSPYPYNLLNKNKKIYKAFILLNKYHKINFKHINFVYVHLRRTIWLKPPISSNTLLVNTRFADVFPNFYIYQKLNLIKGIIYLNLINSKKTIEKAGKNGYLFYSRILQRLSFVNFKSFLIKYSKKNPDIKALLKHLNFIQGVNTIINKPRFPLSYVYFTTFQETHSLKNSVYYFNNNSNLFYYRKIKNKILNLQKKDYYTLFLSDAGGNIGINSGETEGYLDFTLTKRYSYKNNYLFDIFKNYYNDGIGFGYSRNIGKFFLLPQKYEQSVFGMVSFIKVSPETTDNYFMHQNTKRLAELSFGYNYNSIDYNINPQYGSSFNITYNLANPNILSPFSFNQFTSQYTKFFKVDANNIIGLEGIGVFSIGNVPASLDYNLGGINGILGLPVGLPFVFGDTLIAKVDYRRNIYRGLNVDLLDNFLDITSVTANAVAGAGKAGNTVPDVFHKGPLYSFGGLGIHFKTYFLGIYPEMISIYAAKAFGSGITYKYGMRYYFGINQLF
ncbi:MAG: BamA/TamA family outer membrane protein, partial [bacterium]